jgi:uncharacterized protein (DUF1501 family)
MRMFSPSSLPLSRRFWLQAAAGGLGASLWPGPAKAQVGGAYKALVCVFLYGGNDGHNTVVPLDDRYARYAAVRGPLALPQGACLPLEGIPFGLHPSLAPLMPMWRAGQMAPVFNVGPLQRPFAGKADYLAQRAANSADVPPNLFSHADQQGLWQAADGESVSRTGWGGRAAAQLVGTRSVVSIGRNAHFGTSLAGPAVVLPLPGQEFSISGIQNVPADDRINLQRRAAFLKLYAKNDYPTEMERVFAAMQNEALKVSDSLSGTVKSRPGDLPGGDPVGAAFAGMVQSGSNQSNTFAAQLFQVAKLIRLGQSTGSGPQIFFVGGGDFDFHAGQLDRQSALLTQVGSALAAFHTSMQALGLGGAVTSFTESDFGRTLKPNHSGGTDHAWGNTQLVLGGAVRGKATYGTHPELTLGGPDDVGQATWEQQGRWIPTTSVEQYAATLLSWLGASDGQLSQILPRLGAFTPRKLGFL